MIHNARGVGMYILKMYIGLKNRADLRLSIQRKKQKTPGKRIEMIVHSAFNA
jgi:hypothetical protein